MKIVINEQNEIVSYCVVGDISGSIKTNKTFPSQFEIQKFIYDKENDEILLNDNFIDNRVEIEKEINDYKKMLNDTDYKAIKYAEGVMTDDEYAETKELRQEWRRKINELEIILNK